jgi:hypothetical protein
MYKKYPTRLIAICQPSHTTHNTKDVIVGSIDTNLGSLGSLNGSVREDKLKSSIINSGKVAGSGWLVLLRAEGKRVDVDTLIRVASMGLVRLNPRKVRSFTLREAVLSVKLKLGSDNRVLSPTVHVKRGLGKDKGSGIRDTRVLKVRRVSTRQECRVNIRW